jgi:hypothetical protein
MLAPLFTVQAYKQANKMASVIHDAIKRKGSW